MKIIQPKYLLSILILILFIPTTFTSCNYSNTEDEYLTDSTYTDTETSEIKKRFGIAIEDYTIIEQRVKANQPFSSIMNEYGLGYPEINKLVILSDSIFDVRKIRQGNKYFVFQTMDSLAKMDYLLYQLNAAKYVKFSFKDSIQVSHYEIPIQIDTCVVQGVIESSLWMSMSKNGIDPMLALKLSDIYAWTIDFYGLQKGDSFNVVFESRFIDTTYIGLGKVIACHFYHTSHNFQSYIFEQDNIEDYFDEQGGSLRRAFLKAPLKFGRISSRFSNSRLHPVLKIRRPHHGVDYAAPTGTPILTIGDGKVTFLGKKGGYGRRIEIKHNGTYSTGYAHMSRFAKGLKVGDYIKQGTVIGYVGSSGLATGPHLDFRVYKNGTPIDPLSMKSPPAVPIKATNRDAYKNKMDELRAILTLHP